MGDTNESVEMYLKRLYEFHLIDPRSSIRTSQLAQAMQVSDASASEMLVRLGLRGLVDRVPYKGVTMSAEGVRIASSVKRREQLLEIFLADMLGYTGDVNEAACRLEHAIGDDLESLIDRLLGYPELSHHGDVIPSTGRTVEPFPADVLMPLRALPDAASGRVSILLFDGGVVRSLQDIGLSSGTIVTRRGDDFEADGSTMAISDDLTKRILIRLLA